VKNAVDDLAPTHKELIVPNELLHELFEYQAASNPASIALECGDEQMTYGELETRANQLSRWLRKLGVKRGDCVGLLLPRSIEVYIALLGILKSGAAYVPLDPDYPAERVEFILSDCRAAALVTTSRLASKARGFTAPIITMDGLHDQIGSMEKAKLGREAIGTSPHDLCYVIYTSGTTGKPKGVEIEHGSVCHLVRAESEIFRVTPTDRVFQVASIAFDASVEEIWLAFFSGATLVVGTAEMARAGPELSKIVAELCITVLSCVPTLLMMMEGDVPSLRLLILGGEACPAELVKRWWKPGRRMVNTYGPTEATVIATWAECHPDRQVTIGRPLPNYSACILDEQMQQVPDGIAGELCLGGIGLARGYLGRPELTNAKFISLALNGSESQRFYRTGDLVRRNADGEIEFLGRIDTQVKLRGFRVELAEIEAVLMDCTEIRAAAVTLREDIPGVQQLVAYVVARNDCAFDAESVRANLQKRLPPYMVPAIFESLPSLPTLASGKVDRKALPAPRSNPEVRREIIPPQNDDERLLVSICEKLFDPVPVSVLDDFFLDLGGHSLLAAKMVSELRRHVGFQGISVLDVYQFPTIRALVGRASPRAAEPGKSAADNRLPKTLAPPVRPKAEISSIRHFFCGLTQLVSLVFILSFFALQWLAPYLTYTILIEEEYDFIEALLGAFASLVLFYPIMVLVPIAVKWIVIGRYKAGAYPLWGTYYFRWWLVTTIEAAVPIGYMTGTPLLNIYFRLMGAKIGRNVHLGSESFAIYDLVSIGDDSSINVDSNLLGYTVEDGCLKLGTIDIGKRCFVGTRAALREDTVMEDNAALEDLSLLSRGKTIPKGEVWEGSPARRSTRVFHDSDENPSGGSSRGKEAPYTVAASAQHRSEPPYLGCYNTPRTSRLRRLAFGLLHGVGLLIFPVLVVTALFPGIVAMNELNYLDPYYWYLLLAPAVGISFIAFLALEIAVIKWLLLGKVKPGHYPIESWYYLRKWFVDQAMDLSLDILGPLYASVYLTPWYKLLGARLGKGAEISTASFISPDLLSIGDESFIADSASLGAPRIRDGFMTIGRNHIGKRSFIGNSAMLPPETVIGDDVLIGCLSAPPANPADALRRDTAWMGSPAIFLPQRQRSSVFSEAVTFEPPARLRIQRAVIEFIRVIAPSTGFIILISLLFSGLLLLRDYFSLIETLLFFPLLYIGCGTAATLFTILAKWVVIRRYSAGEKPLWNNFVWRNELINALHEHLAEPFLVGALTGTPFVCWYFRLLGARIGRRVYMETTDFSEFDLATVGDEAMLNADCTIQTHLFEDRVMKMSTIEIGSKCKVGAGSLVLYDTRMEQGSALGDLSLLMKGEVLPKDTKWEGIPARKEENAEHQTSNFEPNT
jgi:non-ribosomal peptide synthetase-like protein